MRFLKGHTRAVRSLAFSPDLKLLASVGQRGDVFLWDLAGSRSGAFDWGVPRTSLTGHTDLIAALAFAPNGTCAAAGGDADVVVWDLDD